MTSIFSPLWFKARLYQRLTQLFIIATVGLSPVGLLAQDGVPVQDYDQLIQQAVAQRNAGDLQAAEQSLRAAYPMPPDKTEVSTLLALVIAFQTRYEESINLLDQALTDNPDDIGLRLGKARVRAFQGLFPEATGLVEAVLQQYPDNI